MPHRALALLFLLTPLTLPAQSPAVSATVPGRLVVFYRNATIPSSADRISEAAGAHVRAHLTHIGASLLSVTPGDEATTIARLRLEPEVATVLQDRIVTGHAIAARPATQPSMINLPENQETFTSTSTSIALTNSLLERSATLTTIALPATSSTITSTVSAGSRPVAVISQPATDSAYNSVTGWAVIDSGGYGDSVNNGPAAGPWTTSRGAGIRIAILDSGIDPRHPDLYANLVYNQSEIDQNATTGLPSACDDGSPVDQQGHGTWVASLAAAAAGPNTGQLIGVAPQATLLNIKVLERVPGSGADLTTQCENGQTGGLMSWVLAGINDAIAQHANVIVLSLGSVVDLSTGDGAGWQAQFDQVTYAAAQAGTVIVAAAGNDSLNLSGGRYIELPAQARDVLGVTASTNPACIENLNQNATCNGGPITRPSYSNYGITGAIAAPGGNDPEGPDNGISGWIYGACSDGEPNTADGLPADGDSFGCFNLGHVQYIQAMGTSASAPLVAGAAAIVMAAHPDWTAAQVIDALRSTATPSSATDPQLNLAAALNATE